MLSFTRMWAVARYELIWDLRKRRTYLIVGVLFLAALIFGYLVPAIGGKWTTLPPFSSGASFESSLWWVNAVNVAFNALASGLFPLLIGGFIAADSLATEFDTNTIVPLLSQPVTRLEVYGGKFLEKFLLLLFVSALFTLMVLIASEASVGDQAQFDAFPLVVSTSLGPSCSMRRSPFLSAPWSGPGAWFWGSLPVCSSGS